MGIVCCHVVIGALCCEKAGVAWPPGDMRENDNVGSEKLDGGAAGRAAHDGWTLGLLKAVNRPGINVAVSGEANCGIRA